MIPITETSVSVFTIPTDGPESDGTLEWTTAVAPDCSRVHTVRVNRGGTMTEVFRREAAAPSATQGQPAPSCPA